LEDGLGVSVYMENDREKESEKWEFIKLQNCTKTPLKKRDI